MQAMTRSDNCCKNKGICILRNANHDKNNGTCMPRPSNHCKNNGICIPRPSNHSKSHGVCIPRDSNRCKNNGACNTKHVFTCIYGIAGSTKLISHGNSWMCAFRIHVLPCDSNIMDLNSWLLHMIFTYLRSHAFFYDVNIIYWSQGSTFMMSFWYILA